MVLLNRSIPVHSVPAIMGRYEATTLVTVNNMGKVKPGETINQKP